MADSEIIIIGAGPAGLAAAYRLCQSGYKPLVIEASPYTGGLSRTHKYKEHRIDLGGHRFFTRDKEVMDFWKSILPVQGAPAADDRICDRNSPLSAGGPDPDKENDVFMFRRRISRIFFRKKFFDYPVAATPDTFRNLGFKLTFKAAAGYISSLLFRREEKSLEDFYINRFGQPLYSMFFEKYTEKLWGVHPSKISPSWGAQRIKEVSILSVLKNSIVSMAGFRKKTKAGDVDFYFYPKYGPGQMYEILADQIIKQGGTIIHNSEVTGIITEGGTIKKIKTSSGNILTNPAAVFSTMPVKDLVLAISRGCADNGLPGPVREITETATGLPYRDYSCVALLLPELKIKNQTEYRTPYNMIPDTWLYIQEPGIKAGRIQIYNNWSPYLCGKKGYTWIAMEYFMQEGDSAWTMNDEEFINLAKKELAETGFADPSKIEDAVRIRVKKAYPAYFGTYDRFEKIRQYLDGIDNLYCLGRNGQHRYNNMDHSILTAFEAVRLFLESRKTGCTPDKKSLWSVNTKQEYHEDKKKK